MSTGPREGAGDVLAGRYRIERLLGEGGMGEVWAALDLQTGEHVAVKRLKAGVVDAAAHRRRFSREARLSMAVVHPNIVRVRDVIGGATPLIVMDMLDGETVRARLARRPLTVSEVMNIMVPVVSAIGTAHALGIVHRDVKPENLFLEVGGGVKVLDFGIAKLGVGIDGGVETAGGHALTETGALLGTPLYMSPEQVFGERDVDHRADVWAVGVILYECLTGRHPFASENIGQLIKAISAGTHTPLSELSPLLPAALVGVVEKCLNVDRAARPRDLLEVSAALRENLNVDAPDFGAATIAAIAISTPDRVRRRRGFLLLGIGLSTIGLAVGAAGLARRSTTVATTTSTVDAASTTHEDSRPLGIVDTPASSTGSAKAAALFRTAMRALADGNGDALPRLDDAIALDETFASAQLLRAYLELYVGGEKPAAHFAAAMAHRETLPPAQMEMLTAFASVIADPRDWRESARRFEAILARRPDDPWALSALATSYLNLRDYPKAIAMFRRQAAADVDSTFGMDVEAQLQLSLDDLDGAKTTLDACVLRQPTSLACQLWTGKLLAVGGRCAEADAVGRNLIAANPDSVAAREVRLDAQAGLGGADELLADLSSQIVTRDHSGIRPFGIALYKNQIAFLGGDFTQMDRIADAVEADAGAGATPELLTFVDQMRDDAADASGDRRRQGMLSLKLLRRMNAGSVPDPADDQTIMYIADARRAGALSDAEFRRRRASWEEVVRARTGAEGWETVGPLVWAAAYGLPAETKEEAVEAMARRPAYGKFPKPGNIFFFWRDFAVGRACLLAGELEEAAARLGAASRVCSFFQTWPMADLELGRLHEAQKDTDAACASYARVLHRWGHAKPRSVIADDARARASKLGCPPAGASSAQQPQRE